ncbi:MAG TPA: tetratricopeptide repeat protein [Xanthobacteraceae bacterium]
MPEAVSSLSDALTRAHAAHELGRLNEAERICLAILAAEADHVDALHLLAVVQSRRGNHMNALASYERALAIRPDHPEALYGCGNTLYALGRFKEAVASYDRVLAMRPNTARALNNRGNALRRLKRYDEALASYEQAVRVRPNYSEALNNRGICLYEIKRYEDALASYEQALAIQSDRPEMLNNRGICLHRLRRLAEAIESYDAALAIRPDYCEALKNRGVALDELKRFEEALADYDKALAIRPDLPDTLNNRGLTLQRVNRAVEALACYERALALRPDDPVILNNRANSLVQLGRFEEARASFDAALAIDPDYAQAHVNSAYARLLLGDFARGWEEHEWRWQLDRHRPQAADFFQRFWRGNEDIAGKTILLHSEQGFGDSIQFSRYAILLAERGARVVVTVPLALARLFARLAGVHEVVAGGPATPPFDFHCSLMSLPLAFATRLDTVPAMPRYLSAPADMIEAWRARLRSGGRLRVGIAWSGNPDNWNDHNRSMPLDALLPLTDLPIEVVSLQKDVPDRDRATLDRRADIADFGPRLTDFLETAALASLVDVVVTVDSAVAHLAGALGRPTWILLAFLADWRWLLDREDSPWYPSARLFRQRRPDDWDEVVARVKRELARLLDRAGTAGR